MDIVLLIHCAMCDGFVYRDYKYRELRIARRFMGNVRAVDVEAEASRTTEVEDAVLMRVDGVEQQRSNGSR